MSKSIVSFLKKNPILFLVLYGIFIRGIVLYFYQIPTLFPDSNGYILLAEKISNFSLEGYDGTRSPGYPLLISLSNNSLLFTVLSQLLLGLFSIVLCYKSAIKLLLNKKNAFLTAFFFSSLLQVVFFETAILTEALTFFLISLIFFLLLKNKLENSSFKQDLGFSFLLGFLILVKPFYIFFPFLIFIAYVFNNFNIKKNIARKLVLFVFPLAAFLGWSSVNKTNTGYFVSTTFYGFNMAQNCVFFAEKTPEQYKKIGTIYAKYRDKAINEKGNISMSIWNAQEELSKTTNLSLVELSNTLSQYSKATIKQNPSEYLKQVVISWWDFWKTNLYSDDSNFISKKASSFFNLLWYLEHYPLRLFKLLFLLTVPLQIVSFFKTKIIDSAFLMTLIVISTSVMQAFVTYGTNSRFSYPFEFIIVVLVVHQLHKYSTIFTKN